MVHWSQRTRDELIHSLGLQRDPFKQRVTEKESDFNFGQLYVETEQAQFQRLLGANSTFLFADYGMGKTATRLSVEYSVRFRPDMSHVLAVRYHAGNHLVGTNGLAEIERTLCADIAIDSLIQFVERYHLRYREVPQELAAALEYHARLLPRSWRATRLGDRHHGATFSSLSQRPEVRKLHLNQAWQSLIRTLLGTPRRAAAEPVDLTESLHASKILGFDTLFVLVDGIDAISAASEQWTGFMDSLIEALPYWQKHNIFIKCFLPLDAKDRIATQYAEQLSSLTPPPDIFTIEPLTPDVLRHILRDRFLAYRQPDSYVAGFEILATPGIESIDDWLAEHAQGSPRELLRLASELLDFHTNRGYQDNGRLHMTTDEWQAWSQERSTLRL